MKSFMIAAFVLSMTISSAWAAKSVTLNIGSVGDTMAFDKTELSVPAGATVKLTFKNNAKKDTGLEHNWVLTQAGADADVATKAISAGAANGWFQTTPAVIAHTKMLKAGEKETVTFTAPAAAGSYPYLCTFPGHNAMMKGTLKVTAK